MSTNPIADAIATLRHAADTLESLNWPILAGQCREDASALAAYFAEPAPAEVERLVKEGEEGGLTRPHPAAAWHMSPELRIRAVLRAIGGEP